ncbi:unnamed protein product [Cyberlindnera jadinii]|uniref:Uncharacterized protein n=1 Tax=Cyberlindnera jadinii (strain ATCC 18201 / CBS 1600 / BCRC 20928 / JCM 3617 / NBRC 0987 / NRRL Y-1542) TaxID=983966 RepID=A0A0H5BY23_CYBJN|nr:unnamed protein product [Cyberlindnera jadinii]
MLILSAVLLTITHFQLSYAADASAVSNTDTSEFGAYVNPSPKNICDGEEFEMLTFCASEVLSRLDECKPDDLACECCALQSMKRDCHGLCPNTPSGNFLAVLYDDCETMNDVNACNLPFKKHDAQVAKFLRPNARIPVEEKEPDFILQSVLVNTSNETALVIEDIVDEPIDLVVQLNETVENITVYSNSTQSAGEDESAASKITVLYSENTVLLAFFCLGVSICYMSF